MRLGVQAALVDGRLVPGDVAVEDGAVSGVGLARTGAERGIAVPGFVDLQVNGFAGVDFMTAGVADWERAGEALLEGGVTAFRPTFVTAPEDVLVECLRGMPRRAGAQVIGAHLEGPFLSPERMGAHDPRWRRDPDLALLKRLLAAGPVGQVTLAPELPGALELVDALRALRILVSAGHTNATAAEAHAAFDRGVRTVTHLFNAMRPAVPRDPGVAYAALARDDVVVQLIVDGRHLASDTVLAAWRAARDRLVLVTDAAGPTLGGRDPGDRLAGSALTMLDGVRNLHALGVPLEEALAAATTRPARLAGLNVRTSADLVVLDDRLEILRVLVGGGERVAG